jgi:arylsulfatase A-like enzyme
MYHAGWAWAGSTPYRGTKLQGAYFGGIRNPMAVSWPKKIKASTIPRSQFHHVIDIVPTVYDLLDISPPKIVNGFAQDDFNGISLTYTFEDAAAKGQRSTQFFDIMASRGIYHDGWFARSATLWRWNWRFQRRPTAYFLRWQASPEVSLVTSKTIIFTTNSTCSRYAVQKSEASNL